MSGNAAKGKCPVGEGSAASAQEWDLTVYGFLANFGARRFPKGNEGKTQGGLPLGNPVCLWQTELFKLNLKSSPSSSGYNRRRRLATGRSGKQQAERTAVRTAPIVCPEESPLVRPQAHTPVPEWPDAPTTAREWALPSPLTCRFVSIIETEGVQGGTKGRRKAGCPWATRSAFGRLNFSN